MTLINANMWSPIFFLYKYNIITSGLHNKLILPKAKPPYKDRHKNIDTYIFTLDHKA